MGVLDDVTVIELSIAIAAPSCCRMLAFHGAEVVKLESRTNPDVARLFGSAWAIGIDPGPYMDSSPYLAEMSANKRSVGLHLKFAEARDAALTLLAAADVFVTNYSTPAVRALGLSYEDVVAVNPGIVYVALPGFGSDPTQPYYEFLAWGPNQAPLVGLDELTGHPDQVPAGIATISPPDFFAGLHALTGVLTGLEHRDRTGEGSFVDIAQFETTVSALGPFLLDHQLSGHNATRTGNRLAWLAPQGVYPCAGEEEWVALTVADDRQWLALAELLGDEAIGEQYAALDARLANHDELDALITRWTSTRSPGEAATALQAAGVAAHEVLSNHGRARRRAGAVAALVPGGGVEALRGRRCVQRPPDPPRRRPRVVVAGRPVDGRGHHRRARPAAAACRRRRSTRCWVRARRSSTPPPTSSCAARTSTTSPCSTPSVPRRPRPSRRPGAAPCDGRALGERRGRRHRGGAAVRGAGTVVGSARRRARR